MREWFIIRFERQFICFVTLLLTFHLISMQIDGIEKYAYLNLIPVVFSLINFFSFILKGIRKSIWEPKYLLIALLYPILTFKFIFTYYTI